MLTGYVYLKISLTSAKGGWWVKIVATIEAKNLKLINKNSMHT